MKRRDFIEFLGYSALTVASSQLLISCSNLKKQKLGPIKGIKPNAEDKLVLADGFEWRRVISWGDKISAGDTFGFNNDYLNYVSVPENKDEYLLWANHEYVGPSRTIMGLEKRTKDNIDTELKSVGGSIVHIYKDGDLWKYKENSGYNRRIDGFTPIKFSNKRKIKGSQTAMGTLANCAGGKTPWGTILTCEENYQFHYGDRKFGEEKISKAYDEWNKFYPHPPEHYGWVVEVNPLNGDATKLVELGRFAHECATVVESKEGLVVYSGDDKKFEHIYKFVSDSKVNLNSGTLYVADIKKGKWLPLDVEKDQRLKDKFKTQENVLVYTREAAKVVGATPLDRPEDIEINPINGDVVFTLTNNNKNDNHHGKICKISEKGNYTTDDFIYEELLIGGENSGFSCPDNLGFDPFGNLWFASDISGSKMNKGIYKSFGNNGLFLVPASGPQKGEVIQIASAPIDAEFTGICFAPDGKSLLLSVQHPGETSKSQAELSSNWPFGHGNIPRSSVVQISGDFFKV